MSLYEVYKKHGIEYFLEICEGILKSSNGKPQDRGLTCEIVLKCITEEYIKFRHTNMKLYSSLILRDFEGNPNFRTELDLVVLTPSVCFAFECKSYRGDLELYGDGILKSNTVTHDLLRQSKLHCNCLRQYLRKYRVPSHVQNNPIAMAGFLYSCGTILDSRSQQSKLQMPVLTLDNIFQYYDRVLSKYTAKVFDVGRLDIIFQECTTKDEREAHRKYLGV